MTKRFQKPLSFLIIVAAVFWSFHGNMPHNTEDETLPENQFSTTRAFKHVETIARQPHYVGSHDHSRVRNYIISELQDMDLLVQTQERYSLNKYGTLTRPQNIISRIKGSTKGKALLLLTHYDSAIHSSRGASDAASGVATILEGIRAFLASEKEHENDIIIVFTDAEELGLNGADIFVNDHPWVEEVGLALNFESRGSGGNSFMLLETNRGNKKLIEHFMTARPNFPVTNSLAYSVYKMLPNDTDLTVLREQADINGFNFAFIDDHFDYHTATDIPENLDKNSLAHQGSYLMPLLNYFSNVPLQDLGAAEDVIYFNIPVFKMLKYPFSWIFPMLFSAILFFVALVIYGLVKKRLHPLKILKGFLPLFISVAGSGVLVYAIWQFCLFIYPEYLEMEQGFTYNGYFYIAAVIFLSLTICFYTYRRFQKGNNPQHLFVAPLFFWLFISTMAAVYLKGAAYFVIPVFFGLLQFYVLLRQQKPNLLLLSMLSLPAIFILLPFVVGFPVALGLKMLPLAAVLLVFLWVLLWPIFGFYKKNQTLGFLCFLTFIVFFILAHFKSDFNEKRPKPNSLVYLFDADHHTATWNTYDKLTDSWTGRFLEDSSQPKNVRVLFSSKYNTGFSKSAKAPLTTIPEPFIQKRDLGKNSTGFTTYQVKIVPNRDVNRIEIFTEDFVAFNDFKLNGLSAKGLTSDEDPLHVFKKRWSKRLISYYPVNRDTLHLEFSIKEQEIPDLILYEASHDLLENEELKVGPREKTMIPRPFVLNDAIVVKKTINFE